MKKQELIRKKKQELIRKETAAPTDKAAEDLKRKKCMDFFKLELGPQILKSQDVVVSESKYTRALTFEIF